jgi:uncharacterized membrane protein (UPF0127 family)
LNRPRRLVFCCAIAAYAGSLAAPAPRWAVAVLPNGHEFSLEVAADDISRARGYMGREKIGPREGMIFIFEQDERHSFWMKDCKVALDMVWLDVSGRVVWVAARQPPCPPSGDCPSIVPPSPARYVLEFAAGTASAQALKAGDTVVVLSDPPLR